MSSTTETFRELQSNKENYRCVDCSRNGAQWASVNNGVFICLECSGKHRGLGVHISFVRSTTMDAWSSAQLKMMSIGGNKRFKDFIESYNFDPEVSIPTKYYSKAAEYYRELIKAEAEFRRLTYPPPSAAEGLESCMSIPEIKNKETPQPNNSS
jgi:GTPase-activating protein that regulates ARFs (ADP-ribosylation factors), involved in ARF-mediated vesicular transport